jgi:hypothetical protein
LTEELRRCNGEDAIRVLLELLFDLLEVQERIAYDPSRRAFEVFHFHENTDDTMANLQALAAHVYWQMLVCVPQFVRGWHSSCTDRRLSLAVEALTEKYFSPVLIERELAEVAALGTDELGSAMSARAVRGSAGCEVRCCYRYVGSSFCCHIIIDPR